MTVGRSCVENMLTMMDVAIIMSEPPPQPVKCQTTPTAEMAAAARTAARTASCQSRCRMNLVLAGLSVFGVVVSHSSMTSCSALISSPSVSPKRGRVHSSRTEQILSRQRRV